MSLPATLRICESGMMTDTPSKDWRIAKIDLDEDTILWRSADVEQERRVAMFDLVEENSFKPIRLVERGVNGPYHLRLAVHDGRLALAIGTVDRARDIVGDIAGAETDAGSGNDDALETIILGLARFRRPIREYFAICDSYYQAIRKATAAEIETIDMARRGVHNGAAELLLERLEGKIDTDFATARRLFTLICVLHIKG